MDANFFTVDIRLRFQPIDTNQEVAHFRDAHLAIDHVLKLTPAIGHAAIVETEDDITLSGIELVGQAFPIAIDRLCVRAAISFDQRRVFLAWIEVWRQLDGVIERLAIVGG